MPSIFTQKERDELADQMINSGREIIREQGCKNLKIEDVTKRAGIAKGTFYNFFGSKEEFIYEILQAGRALVVESLQKAADEEGGKVSRERFRDWLTFMWSSDNNVYRVVSYEDYQYISSKWPDSYNFDAKVDEETSLWLLDRLDGVQKSVDWKVFANIQKTLAFMFLNRHWLHPEAIDQTAQALIDAICREIFD